MICAGILAVLLLAASWLCGAAWASKNAKSDGWLGEQLQLAERRAQTYREDALRWKYRALRRGWKPQQAWKNR